MAESEGGGGLTTAGKAVVALFVVILIAAGGYFLSDVLLPEGSTDIGAVDLDAAKDQLGQVQTLEATDTGNMAIVRRYREKPSPLVRDSVRDWRTGRLDRILDGDFDVVS